jgi:[ribosomal protein S5]-alanine N-acetyltransferase
LASVGAARRLPCTLGVIKLPLVLRAISTPELQALSAGMYTSRHLTIADGALPPAHVAVRALRLLSEGQIEQWCSTYFMVQHPQNLLVGACGFKGQPVQGRVEIGYGVSPGMRGQGHASAAVQTLLAIAFASGRVKEVLAQVGAKNPASTRVVAKLGFTVSGTRVDEDDEILVQWVATNAA